jgi:hypothetical protein
MHNLFVEEGSPKIWANCGFFKKKTARSFKSPNGRIFAQSSHPAAEPTIKKELAELTLST